VTAQFTITLLSAEHERTSFDCGIAPLNRYLREQVGQDIKRRLGNCFVATEHEATRIAGFYTLAATSIPLTSLPEAETRRLPRYPVLPAVLIGRLAVDTHFQGKQLGAALVIDALRRSAEAAPAAFAILVDAKDENAARFYSKLGFVPLESRPLSLFLPIGTALKLLG